MKIVDGKPYIDQVRTLIAEYAQRLDRDLSFQHLDEELKDPAKNILLRKENYWLPWKARRFWG